MANLKAIIYTTTNGENNLEYGIKDIVSLSSISQVIANEELPNFDYFPNSGTLTVKDNNLVIYNKALNGEFDDFRYKVKYFLNNKPISSHIINERPNYDYESKTCTFYLGNEADYAINQPLPIYAYPLKSQTLYEVFYNLMIKIYNISYEDFEDLMSGVYGKSNLGGSLKPLMTFREYFEFIKIMFPYMSATSAREALKNVLTIAQCGLFINRENKFKLVRLDGYTNRNNIFENTYLIPPSCISQGFVPSVMLSNKFNEIDIEHKLYNLEYHYNELFDKTKLVFNPYGDKVFEETTGDKTDAKDSDFGLGLNAPANAILCQQINLVNNNTFNQVQFPFYLQNNLKNLLLPYDLTLEKPNCLFTIKKTTKTSQCTFDYYNWRPNNITDSYKENNILDFISNETNIETFEETISLSYIPIDFTKTKEFSIPWAGGEVKTTLTVNTKIPENQAFSFSGFTSFANQYITSSLTVLSKIKIVDIYGIKIDGVSFDGANKVETTYEFESVEISLYGNWSLIVFSNGTSKFVNSQNVSNQTTISSTSEIVQDTSYFDNQSNNMINAIGNTALSVYDKGLQTGNLTVISHNYNTYYSFLNKQEETFGEFRILPNTSKTKQLNKLTNKELPKKVIVTDISNIPTEYDLSSNIWDDGTYKIVYNPTNNELVFSYSGTLFWRIKKVVVKYITIDETPEIGNNSNQRPTFELGDQVIPCKDNKGTPIILQKGIPVVYQVVKEETLQQGGAVFQNLTLREVKPL